MAKLGEMLLKEGVLDQAQLDKALAAQKKSGGLLGSILVSQKLVTEQKLVDVLSRQTGVPTIDLEKSPPDATLAKLIPASLARQHTCVPVKLNGSILHVALADPTDAIAIQDLETNTRKTIKVMIAGAQSIESALAKLYDGALSGGKEAKPAAKSRESDQTIGDVKLDQLISGAIDDVKVVGAEEKKGKVQGSAIDLELGGDVPAVIKMVNGFLLKAIQMRASDIHLEPFEEELRVRFRIDGVLHKVISLPGSVKSSVVSRIKIMGDMDIAEHRFPQDGRIKVQLNDKQTVDFRVSVLPSIFGEKVVIRVLGQGSIQGTIEGMGLPPKAQQNVLDALASPHGMVLVTGPTGSGKTTTLYTFLKHLNTEDVNIVTAEDPVEYNMHAITQVAVKPTIGFTFDLALRSFLRQDPDIIMVGEMRDYETAAIAVKAALTGHLVLSTLHTNDAPSTVVRMIDMGIEPYLVASAVKLVIAQRLVRRVCKACKEEVPPSDAEKANLTEEDLALLEHTYRGKGCKDCNGIGYRGRAPVFEVMTVRSREMKRIITEGGTEVQVAQVARKEDLRSLKEEALRMVNDGTTSVEEALGLMMAE